MGKKLALGTGSALGLGFGGGATESGKWGFRGWEGPIGQAW